MQLVGYDSDYYNQQYGSFPLKPKKTKSKRHKSGVCCYCEVQLNKSNYSKDHLIPRSKGGRNKLNNTKDCCKDCNSEKADMTLERYIEYLHFTNQIGVKLRNAKIWLDYILKHTAKK